MSDINNEAVVEQIAEGLAEELDREPTNAEIANEVERREGWTIDAVDVFNIYQGMLERRCSSRCEHPNYCRQSDF